jgi:hypothetical protein
MMNNDLAPLLFTFRLLLSLSFRQSVGPSYDPKDKRKTAETDDEQMDLLYYTTVQVVHNNIISLASAQS